MSELHALSDEEVAAVGTWDAVDVLYHRYADDMLAFLARKTNLQDAENLLQDLWLKVNRELPGNFPRGNFRAWLFRIANNLFIDEYRRAKRTKSVAISTVDAAARGADPLKIIVDEESDRDRQDRLQKCMKELADQSPRSAQLMRLLVEGTPIDDICKILKLERQQVYNLKNKSLTALQNCVGTEDL